MENTHNSKLNDNCYCGSCDRGFASEEDYQTHCAGHVTCGIDGCWLSADPKVIDNHVQMQHKSGLYKRLVNENPEDIQKWIEERKRKFPTKLNVQKNREKLNEMEKRGERLHKENDRFGKRKRGNETGNQPPKVRKIKQEENAGKKQKQRHVKKVFKEEAEREHSWRGELPHFPGTALFPSVKDEESDGDEKACEANENDKLGNDFSDNEWENDGTEPSNASTTALPAALLSISSYNSGSESDPEEDESVNKSVDKNCSKIDKTCLSDRPCSPEPQKFNFSIETNDDDDSPPEEVKIQKAPPSVIGQILENESSPRIGNVSKNETSSPVKKEQVIDGIEKNEQVIDDSEKNEQVIDDSEKNEQKEEIRENDVGKVDKESVGSKESRKRVRNHKKPDKKPSHGAVTRSRRRLTLLEKLLGPEIRHERNVILQCVRYVVENNFFDK